MMIKTLSAAAAALLLGCTALAARQTDGSPDRPHRLYGRRIDVKAAKLALKKSKNKDVAPSPTTWCATIRP